MSNARVSIVVAAAAFGSLAFFAKLAFEEDIDPLTFLVGRFAVAVAVLACFLALQRATRPTVRGAWAPLAIGAVVYAPQALTLTYAIEQGSVAVAAVLFGTYPIMVLMGTVLFGRDRRVLPVQVMAAVGVVIGVALLVGGSSGTVTALAVALALASAVCFATFVILSDRVLAGTDRVANAAWCCVGAGSTVLVVAIISGLPLLPGGTGGSAAVVAAGLVSTAAAFVLMFQAVPRVGPATAGVVLGAEPVVTVALGVMFLGESLAALQLAGMALVLASVAAVELRRSKRHDGADRVSRP